jgi:hypothetical protein
LLPALLLRLLLIPLFVDILGGGIGLVVATTGLVFAIIGVCVPGCFIGGASKLLVELLFFLNC